MSKECYHRWTSNGVCIIPGCRAVRDKDKPLGPYESEHVPWKRTPRSAKPSPTVPDQRQGD